MPVTIRDSEKVVKSMKLQLKLIRLFDLLVPGLQRARLWPTKIINHSLFGISITSFLLSGTSYAQPLNISVSSAQYTTYVAARDYSQGGATISRTTVSATPFSDEIDVPSQYFVDNTQVDNVAIANANLFMVSDQTIVGWAAATATTRYLFSPLADQTQSIGIQIDARGANGISWTAGQISLMDLTLGSQIWGYSWNPSSLPDLSTGLSLTPEPSTVPWDTTGGITANFALNTDFNQSDQYALAMMVESQAGTDVEFPQMQVTGLQVVPEPNSLPLMFLGLGGLIAIRRVALS